MKFVAYSYTKGIATLPFLSMYPYLSLQLQTADKLSEKSPTLRALNLEIITSP